MIQFRVFGIPKGQPRVKACRRGAFAGVYDPGTADDWKTAIAAEALKHRPEAPLHAPCAIDLTFYMPRPKAHFKKAGDVKPTAPQSHTSKPDLDNLVKAVMDSLNGLGIWLDDSQVYSLNADKQYCTRP